MQGQAVTVGHGVPAGGDRLGVAGLRVHAEQRPGVALDDDQEAIPGDDAVGIELVGYDHEVASQREQAGLRGFGQAATPAQRDHGELAVVGVRRVDGLPRDRQVVDEPGRREGVRLEKPPGQRVVHADRVVVATGDPQPATPIDVETDGHPAFDASDEDRSVARAGATTPDRAVGERSDIQAATECARDALRPPAVRECNCRWKVGRGGGQRSEPGSIAIVRPDA